MAGSIRPGIRTTRRQMLKLAAGGIVGRALNTNHLITGMAQDASPATDMTRELLFETSFPASTFPKPAYYSGFCISTEVPGTSTTYSMPDHVAQTNFVIDGVLTIEKSGPAVILRNNGSIEETGPDDTISLNVGDARIITDHSRLQTYANTGPDLNRWTYCPIGFPTEFEVDYIGVPLTDEACVGFTDADWRKGGLKGKGIAARLDRLTLPSRVIYEFPNDPYPIMRILTTGLLDISSVRADGTTAEPFRQRPGEIPIRIYDTIDSWMLTSTGGEPAVIYEYALQPVEEMSATPTT